MEFCKRFRGVLLLSKSGENPADGALQIWLNLSQASMENKKNDKQNLGKYIEKYRKVIKIVLMQADVPSIRTKIFTIFA